MVRLIGYPHLDAIAYLDFRIYSPTQNLKTDFTEDLANQQIVTTFFDSNDFMALLSLELNYNLYNCHINES